MPIDVNPGSLSSFSRLPHELQLIILRLVFINDPTEYLTYLGDGEADILPLDSKREQLKRVRCMNRIFCDAVNPAVFASIHISASRASLRRARNIAESSFAGYVREIVYHDGTFVHQNPNPKQFLSTLASHRRRQDYPAELKGLNGKELHVHYLEEIEEAKLFEGFRSPQMNNIFRSLPNLVTIVCKTYHNEWNDPETSAYTLRRTGLSYLPLGNPITYSYIVDFLKTSRAYNIRALNLSLFPPAALGHLVSYDYHATSADSGKERTTALSHLKAWLKELRYLKLGTNHGENYGLPPKGTNSWNNDTDLFLQACDSLTNLELTYGFATWYRDPLLPPGTVPNLQTLTLSNETFTSKLLKDCLLSLSSSLRHINFQDIELVGNSWPVINSKLDESIVQLLYDVSPKMSLQSCTGVGTVECCKTGSRGAFNTCLGHVPGKEVMVKKVQEAVCHRRPWPRFENSTKGLSASSKISREVAFFQSHWDDMVDLFEVQTVTPVVMHL
ncbi:hypothetical protein H2198_003979 [Neophaeococcomyces mojaviensis]|uniref:Uncharacterized protein n=1 Tax=Neophaeococcomyces mojaviensis TaxID=3383035 RepID=A0ACC3A9W8_9EURO|nr:hypothetical protein H2198_003979 [Knufia sp. JES_112]